MCGIFQVFSKNQAVDRERFSKALGLMKHRGPDHTGELIHDTAYGLPDGGKVYVASGHQRLSILDLDPRSHQPFRREGCTLVFNGEIYNYRELRESIRSECPEFATTGDTEVLFHGLRLRGLDFVKAANGMWAFSFLDEGNRRVLASRDRHGKKPFFYYHDEQVVVMSSTMHSIFAYLGRVPRLRDDQVQAYLAQGVMYPGAGAETHFHDIQQIPAGGNLRFDFDSWEMRHDTYFCVADEVVAGRTEGMDLAALIKDAVISRLVSDRKVGLLLSGGVDSTIVLSVIHACGLQDQVHCFIGETGRSDDAEYAKRCVALLGIEATVVNLGYGKDTFSRVLKMCAHQEKAFPFLGSSMGMSEMYEHIATHDVRVVLDGTGGDEIFGGYWDRYYPIAVREAAATGDWAWLRAGAKHTPRFGVLAAKGLGNVLMHNRLVDFDPRSFRKRFSPVSLTLGLHRYSWRSLDPLACPPARFTEALVRDASPGGRLGEWIWHNDRNAMMSGIENRSPILDYRLIPYMGNGYITKFVREWNKHQLRTVFDAFSPLPTQWRQQKQGFRWNGKIFLRENRDAILDLISSSRYLASRYSVKAFVDKARTSNRYLTSGATPRLMCIAGIEQAMGLGVE